MTTNRVLIMTHLPEQPDYMWPTHFIKNNIINKYKFKDKN